MKIFNSGNKWFLFLLIILFVHLISNVFWIIANNAPVPWDPAAHTYITLDIKESLEKLSITGVLNSSNYYPIFIHSLSALTVFILDLFSKNTLIIVKLIQMLGSIYFLFTLVFVYLYTRLVTKSSKVAFIATTLFSLFPIIYSQSRWLLLDIPLCGVLIVDLYFLEKSVNFTNKRNSLLFFLFAGFLMLTKWTGLIMLFFPIIQVLIGVFKKKNLSKSFINIILGSVLSLSIILPWYLTNFAALTNQTKVNIVGEIGADPSYLLGMENLTQYLKFFINFQVTPILALVFFISTVYLISTKDKKAFYFLALIAFYYVVFSFISNKDPRYTMSILPFVAITIALALNKIEKKLHWFKYIGFILILIYLTYAQILTIRPRSPEGYRLFFYAPVVNFWVNIVDITDILVEKYDTNTWNVENVLYDFTQINKKGPSKILAITEYKHFNPSTLSTYAKAGKFRNIVVNTPDVYSLISEYHQNSFPSSKATEKYLNKYDYIFVAINQAGPDYLRNRPALDQIRSYFVGNYFRLCADYLDTMAIPKSKCIVRNGEKLSTKSDILTESNGSIKNKELLIGPTVIYCEYGCSFQKISYEAKVQNLKYKLIKSYSLPNGELVNLYKLN